MALKYDIEFVEADAPIQEPVTKFGGQPVWIEEPQWPLSRQLGRQMQFVCQISLDSGLFDVPSGEMAYLFITGEGEHEWVDGTYDPNGGENAVVVQPGGANSVETAPASEGPSLFRFGGGGGWDSIVPCEYSVSLEAGEDPEYVVEDVRLDWSEEEFDAYETPLDGNKVGGTPGFVQADEFPDAGPWRLLLQLDSMTVPFYVNFGDAGIGYAYISEDGRSGRFLWQCY